MRGLKIFPCTGDHIDVRIIYREMKKAFRFAEKKFFLTVISEKMSDGVEGAISLL